MNLSNLPDEKSADPAHDHVVIGLFLLTLGLVLLAFVAIGAFAFGMMKEVLLLKDAIAATTALPVYLLMVFAIGMIVRGAIEKVRRRISSDK